LQVLEIYTVETKSLYSSNNHYLVVIEMSLLPNVDYEKLRKLERRIEEYIIKGNYIGASDENSKFYETIASEELTLDLRFSLTEQHKLYKKVIQSGEDNNLSGDEAYKLLLNNKEIKRKIQELRNVLKTYLSAYQNLESRLEYFVGDAEKSKTIISSKDGEKRIKEILQSIEKEIFLD